MVKEIRLSSFRSIREQSVKLSRINIFYGRTATGKSSLLYAPLVLRNFIRTPSQPVDALFNLGFVNLGGFTACVSGHKPDGEITIGLTTDKGSFELFLRKDSGKTHLVVSDIKLTLAFQMPYSLNQNVPYNYKRREYEFVINWNGIHAGVTPKLQTVQSQQIARDIATEINSVVNELANIDIVPHRRGFFKPVYSPTQISHILWTDDEVATLIMNDANLAPKISVDLEKILDRDFRIYTPPGTAVGYLKTTHKSTRTPVDLVNDGFGVNQIVYMLAKIHRSETNVLLIEEPEVHLHPSVISKLVDVLVSIAIEENKQLLIVTHSEMFIFSLLRAVVNGLISIEEVKVYFTEKKGKYTNFVEQKVNEHGQIEGGLKEFIDVELKLIEDFLSSEKIANPKTTKKE